MKKAFAISSLSVWTLALLIGLGIAVMQQVNSTNTLFLENRQLGIHSQSLASERDSLLQSVKSERSRGDQYLRALRQQNEILFELATPPTVKSVGSPLREE